MAQIDFTAGYRDATKGSTIKALQKRRDEIQAANEIANRPQRIDSPWQGAAAIGNTISGAIREGRVANQEAAGRQRFAELLAGGLAPDEIGEAMGLDPETTMKYQERIWSKEDTDAAAKLQREQRLETHGWDVDAATARVRAEKDAATAVVIADQNAAKLEADAKVAADKADRTGTIEDRDIAIQADKDAAAARAGVEETQAKTTADLARETDEQKFEREQGAPQTTEAKLRADLAANRITQQDFDAAMAKETQLTVPKSVGRDEMNKLATKEVHDWDVSGGPNMVTSVTQLHKAIDTLQTKGGTGLMAGLAEENLPPSVANWLNPDGTIARDAMRTAVQSTLKATLGTQFAAIEGEQLMDRTFSTKLPVEENIRRARIILEQNMQIAFNRQEMSNYWHANNGDMTGYTPTKPVDLEALRVMFPDTETTGGTDTAAGGTTAEPSKPADIPQVEWDNMTPEDKALFR